MKKVLIIFLAQFYVSLVFSQNNSMNISNKIIISESLLNKNIHLFEDKFKKLSFKDAIEKFGNSKYSYLYTGKPLFFLGSPINNIGVHVKDGKVFRFRFEISYKDKDVFEGLMKHFGAPYRITTQESTAIINKQNIKFYQNYGYENCTEFLWHKNDNEFYVYVNNIIEESCFSKNINTILITYSAIRKF
mgnify:CR=1 FL=1